MFRLRFEYTVRIHWPQRAYTTTPCKRAAPFPIGGRTEGRRSVLGKAAYIPVVCVSAWAFPPGELRRVHARAAEATAEDAREELWRVRNVRRAAGATVAAVAEALGHERQAGVGGLPERLVHNAELGPVLDDPHRPRYCLRPGLQVLPNRLGKPPW